MTTEIACAVLALIQDRAAAVLGRDEPSEFTALSIEPGRRGFLEQLNDAARDVPEGLSLDVSRLLDELNVLDLVGDGDSPGLVSRLQVRIAELGDDLRELGTGVLAGRGIGAVHDLLKRLGRGGLGVAGRLPQAALSLLRHQVGIGVSFVTTLRNLATLDLARQIPEGWNAYFYAEQGFRTVDGIPIVAPAHGHLLSRLAAAELAGQTLQESLRGLLNERRAEQYVRDMIRTLVEVAGDARYKLRERHAIMGGRAADQAKATRWFKGAGSMAESLVTSAIEEVTLGVAQFQTNPVIAAAAATYAGTAARKATQHVFLAQLGIPA